MEEVEVRNIKVWRVKPSSSANFHVLDNTSVIMASKKNFIAVDKDSGISIWGTGVSFGCFSEKISTGGFFIKMNDFAQMIPATLVTPMPSNIPFPPLALPQNMIKDIANLAPAASF